MQIASLGAPLRRRPDRSFSLIFDRIVRSNSVQWYFIFLIIRIFFSICDLENTFQCIFFYFCCWWDEISAALKSTTIRPRKVASKVQSRERQIIVIRLRLILNFVLRISVAQKKKKKEELQLIGYYRIGCNFPVREVHRHQIMYNVVLTRCNR